ncbi:nucleoside recognition domain-containing protein [Thermoanaerobacterium sp. DL9XJH110]|uniref:nucleoside recognition domain-containing protein n=1 Tax=Thermoanaerobacterium sp. DL9XJH110 TaxID=3386643 RepID=UPI003BB57EC5
MTEGGPLEFNEIRPEVYFNGIEKAATEIEALLKSGYRLSGRAIAFLLLQDDEEILSLVKQREKDFSRITEIIERTKKAYREPLQYVIALERQKRVEKILSEVIRIDRSGESSMEAWLDRITVQPLTGIPLLLLVLYFGLYKFVGQFGAGTIVDFIEGNIFEAYINPWINSLVTSLIPYKPLQELLALDYGIITLGLRYAVAIILPIVGTFFLAFSIIEDSGYLPRLALLVDRVFKGIGLNGRAVIPMTLGFGCDTMATLVSRTLETRRERIIATLLLALAIPCSAQLGVIMALLSGRPYAMAVWVGFISMVFLFIGYLTARIMPGERPNFYMEVPPLRVPVLANVLEKTFSRIQWYFLEIVPMFILASVLIWLGKMTGLFDLAVGALAPVMKAMGLPPDAAQAFLFGFFRRDYGAAGLYDLQKSGALNGVQTVVAAATLTLFVPCIAQFSIMVKERGIKTTLAIVAFIFPFAFFAGFFLNRILTALGVVL